MVKIKKKKLAGPQSATKPIQRKMPPAQHRMMRTKLDAARCAVYNLRYELEHHYVELTPLPRSVTEKLKEVEEAMKFALRRLETLGVHEHGPEGVPATV